MSAQQKWQLWGVSLTVATPMTVRKAIAAACRARRSLRIATVNPDFLLRARQEPRFRDVLAASDLCVIDGVGIQILAAFHGHRLWRYAGADLCADLCADAARYGWSVHILCRADGLSSLPEITDALHKCYPHIKVTGALVDNPMLVPRIPTDTHIVLCNYGAPMQEYLLAAVLAAGVPIVAIGVGGALDFLTGRVRRAPVWVRRIGCEWAWRTWQQPQRIGKMMQSVVLFPLMVLWEKIHRKNL